MSTESPRQRKSESRQWTDTESHVLWAAIVLPVYALSVLGLVELSKLLFRFLVDLD